MRVFPWISSLLSICIFCIFGAAVGSAVAEAPREPAKLKHVAPEDQSSPPSPAQAIRSLFSTDQDRVYAARQRVARASFIASKVQAGDIRQVDYSVLQDDPSPELMEGEILLDGPAAMGASAPMSFPEGGLGCSSCQGGADCGTCSPCETVCFPLCFRLPLDNLSFRGGAQAFKGPLNLGMDGSFGFLYGFNWGAPLFSRSSGIGVQFGVNGSNANLYEASFAEDTREQLFLTGGLFRRVDWGWQGGLVVDYMHDEWYYDFDTTQLRGELSWMFQCQGEFGFWFTASDHSNDLDTTVDLPDSSTPTAISETFRPQNMYAFFYRTPLDVCGGEMRISGGWTGDEKGLIGADLSVPIGHRLAVETGLLFLLPGAHDDSDRNVHETWNVGLNLVWYPRAHAGSAGKNYYRPLFNVANNGTFSLRPE